MAKSDLNSILSSLFQGLVGKVCWAVIGGPGTGTSVLLYFGKKNKKFIMQDEVRETAKAISFDPEMWIHIDEASWKIQKDKKIFFACDDFGLPNNNFNLASSSLIGHPVQSVFFDLIDASFVLKINELNFIVSSVCFGSSDSENYTFGCEGGVFTVDGRKEIVEDVAK